MDSNTRSGSDLPTGLEAFQAALAPQEGQFMRGATYIMNKPKDLTSKPSRSPNAPVSDHDRLAEAIQAQVVKNKPPPLPEW